MTFLLRSVGFRRGTCWVPPFELRPGWLVRVYLPNFSQRSNEPLGRDLAQQIALVLIFLAKPDRLLPYARPYQNRRRDYWPWPPTVARYLRKQHQASPEQVRRIAQELELNERQPMRELGLPQRLALDMKGLWLRYEAVQFDFYGLQADSVAWLEQVLAAELARGKAAIGFDNLQLLPPQEPLLYTERVVVTEPGGGHWAFERDASSPPPS
ncbi:hypothetical protein EJV47_06740 [Hymenobacter gummosus]|uniref:Uncharacterized protein n=1 Tax=Hymenobacter gummosus TaxID=1776032 RepID=A0A431U563_9BACT|nr:hypothetical protein [Hymenobacter gummosus]RTQ51492.1 hypothetical protein EJV47_06740 [Hymenobacter gummosus]